MSFPCDKCNKSSEPCEKINRVVTKTREKTYKNVLLEGKSVGKNSKRIWLNNPNNVEYHVEFLGYKIVKENKTQGTEIVKEIQLCGKCSGESNVK